MSNEGKVLEAIIAAEKLSITNFSKKLGVSQPFISQIISEKKELSSKCLVELCNCFDITPERFNFYVSYYNLLSDELSDTVKYQIILLTILKDILNNTKLENGKFYKIN